MTKRPESLGQIYAKEGDTNHTEGRLPEMSHVAVTNVLIRLPMGGFRHLRILWGGGLGQGR